MQFPIEEMDYRKSLQKRVGNLSGFDIQITPRHSPSLRQVAYEP